VKTSEVGIKGKGKNQEVVTVFRGLLFPVTLYSS
jgi:hypothetical protein